MNFDMGGQPSDWSETVLTETTDVDGFVSIQLKPTPKEKYPARAHARRVAKHLGVKSGLIYLEGLPDIIYEDSDEGPKFRQHRYFYYLSGLDIPECHVTYDIKKDLLTAWIPPPNSGRLVIFNGLKPTREEIQADYDFDEVHLNTDLLEYLKEFVHSKPKNEIYLLHALSNSDQRAVLMMLRAAVNYTKLQPAMNAARVIKDSYELALMRKASAITAAAHINVLHALKYLKNEAEIEAIFAATCTAKQAKMQSYDIIAGSGENASTLHYGANNEPLEGRQLVCLDAGTEWKCYASDVTRTFPISGKFTPEAKAIYDLVAKMQDECIAMIKPGRDYLDLTIHAHKVAVKGLKKLGLLQNGSLKELYISGVSAAFLPHGLGHYMGLEVHDVGAVSDRLLGLGIDGNPRRRARATQYSVRPADFTSTASSILETNMVVTVEPGIYFNRWAFEEIWLKDERVAKYINKDLLEKYYPVGGVRIEDDILVTEDGYENMTTAPKGDAALKIINEGKEERGVTEKQKGWFW